MFIDFNREEGENFCIMFSLGSLRSRNVFFLCFLRFWTKEML